MQRALRVHASALFIASSYIDQRIYRLAYGPSHEAALACQRDTTSGSGTGQCVSCARNCRGVLKSIEIDPPCHHSFLCGDAHG